VYAASAHDVSTTIIQGRVIMENRKIKTVDTADIRQHVRSFGEKIAAAAETLKQRSPLSPVLAD